MKPKDFPEANITMNPAPGTEDHVSPLRVFFNEEEQSFTSVWMPSDVELRALNEGAGVLLTLFSMHPPVMVGVETVSLQLTTPEGPKQ